MYTSYIGSRYLLSRHDSCPYSASLRDMTHVPIEYILYIYHIQGHGKWSRDRPCNRSYIQSITKSLYIHTITKSFLYVYNQSLNLWYIQSLIITCFLCTITNHYRADFREFLPFSRGYPHEPFCFYIRDMTHVHVAHH